MIQKSLVAKLASWTDTVQPSALQEMLSTTAQPDMISFALGLPAPELFPIEAYQQAALQVLTHDATALQYGPPKEILKQHVISLMARRGVICKEEQIFLTTGAQQAMNLLAHLFLQRHQPVLLEEIIYTGMQQVIIPFQPQILAVSTSAKSGIDLDHLAHILTKQKDAAFLYCITDGHNPLGISLTQEQRQRLVSLAARYQMPIIEDDAYGFLSYDHDALPPLRALDEQWVCYIGSFSKILAPALRVGWMVVPEAYHAPLSILKEASDINTATFTQRTVAAFLASNDLTSHLTFLRQSYRERRDRMVSLLAQHFPSYVRWHVPNNGMFLWIELPEDMDTTRILQMAIHQEKVAFLPGQAFCVSPEQKATHCMRLNFSHSSLEKIEDGMLRLANVIHQYQHVHQYIASSRPTT